MINDNDVSIEELGEPQREQDRRVDRAISEAYWLMGGSGLSLLAIVALVWALAGGAIALFTLMACFSMLAFLVGFDRFYGLTRHRVLQ